MNYECTICDSPTALTGSCRGCGAPSEVEGVSRRRIGKSEIERLRACLDASEECVEKLEADKARLNTQLADCGEELQRRYSTIARLEQLLREACDLAWSCRDSIETERDIERIRKAGNL